MELRNYLEIVRRRWWVLLICLVLSLAGAAVATAQQTKIYRSGLTFYLSDAQGRPVNPLVAQSAQSRLATYSELVASRPVLAEISGEAGDATPLLSVTAAGVPNTIFFRLEVTSTTPDGALRLAEAYATVFPRYVTTFEGGNTTAGSATLEVLEPPVRDSTLVSPNGQRNLAVGFVLGLVLGVAMVVALEALDRRVRSVDELEEVSGLPMLTSVPSEHRRERLISFSRPYSRRVEALRQVRASLQFASTEAPIRSLVVTSAVVGEGKTSVASDLALAFAEAGTRVVLVDGDFRKPKVARIFAVPPEPGLSNVLRGEIDLQVALRPSKAPGLAILPSGPIVTSPSELLGGGRFGALLEELATKYDLVIIDSAPVLPVADTMSLVATTDAVLVVALVGRTAKEDVREAVDRLRGFQARVVGIVANGVRGSRTNNPYVRTTFKPARRMNFRPIRADAAEVAHPSSAGAAATPRHLRPGAPRGLGRGDT